MGNHNIYDELLIVFAGQGDAHALVPKTGRRYTNLKHLSQQVSKLNPL
jgi:hypothetical protein